MKVAALASDDAAWAAAVERLPDADVYHSAAYHRVAEANDEGCAMAFVAEEGGAMLFHPFMLRPIERVGNEAVGGGWCDLESAYGYAGPLSTTDDPAFLARAWQAFGDWCAQQRVVAEFVRFNPLVRNERLAEEGMRVVEDRQTVVVELTGNVDAIWARYPSVQRNMVRKARNAGLEARVLAVADGLSVFRAGYDETMARVDAQAYYRFTDQYFEAFVRELGDRARVVEVRGFGESASACVLLVWPDRLHYHLSGARGWAASLGATNLMLHEAAVWGCNEGISALHLGGGRTPASDDSLLRFKRSLSRTVAPFRTGRRIHDQKMYDVLCASWLRQAPEERPPYFLLYRLPIG
jgi:hypothetical protein